MPDDAFVLQCMRYRTISSMSDAPNQRKPGFVRSSDSPEPEWSEELKAQHRRLWPSLTPQEQQLVANWRAKHFESNGNGTPTSDSGCAVEQINSKQHTGPSKSLQQLWKLLRVVEAELAGICSESEQQASRQSLQQTSDLHKSSLRSGFPRKLCMTKRQVYPVNRSSGFWRCVVGGLEYLSHCAPIPPRPPRWG